MSSAPATGRSIGHYRVLEKLGEGGMGEVYKARDTRLNRLVAIKLLPPDKVADPERRARFVHEAQAASALNHPNIITIHDTLSDDGVECIVMEYVEGTTLAEKIARGEMRTAEVLKCAAQIADALGRAHAAGIVHRDLKPSNVMVTRAGLVKVVDFGIAKLRRSGTGEQATTVTEARTAEGKVMGTVGYMSPEQVRGQTVDHRSDIFNFGLILYEMLSGKRAFEGASSMEVMSAIIKDPAPELPQSVPAPLRQIVGDCLAKDPDNRFDSAHDIAFALRALETASGPVAVPGTVPRARSRKRRWATAGTLVIAGAALALIVWTVSRYLDEPLDLSAYRFTPFATTGEAELFPAWSPDGKSIAYAQRIGRDYQLMVRSLSAPVPTQLTALDRGLSSSAIPFWSHDGSHVYFVAGWRLWRVGVAGGEPVQVMSDVTGATLSPDGRTLAAWRTTTDNGTDSGALWVASPPEAPPRRYQPNPFEVPGRSSPAFLRFSPDAKALCVATSSATAPELWRFPWPESPGNPPARIFADREFGTSPAFDWMPDSKHVVLTLSGNLWLANIRRQTLQQLTAATGFRYGEPSLTADGQHLALTVAVTDHDIVTVPLDGSLPQAVLRTARDESSASWTADGERMAFVTDRSGDPEMWVRSRRGDWERPIVTSADFAGERTTGLWGAISPDGTRIAYFRWAKSGRGVWVSPASGGTPVRLVGGAAAFGVGVPTWSPAGTAVAFFAVKDGVRGIAVVSTGSDRSPQFLPAPCVTVPAWSHDGRWIACGTTSGSLTLVSADAKTTRAILSPVAPSNLGFVLVWSRDSASLYVASSLSGNARLDRVDITTGKSRKVADLGPIDFSTVTAPRLFGSLAADGKSFLTTAQTYRSDIWILDGFPQPRRWPRFW